MKIAMMSAWNQTSGVSIHAELIGEEWVKAGHDLKVFSFLEDDFHGYSLIGVDQPYITRCFGTPGRSNYLDPIPFLKENYDFFVVQDLGMLPKDKLAKIFPHIQRKAKTILVVHASKLPDALTKGIRISLGKYILRGRYISFRSLVTAGWKEIRRRQERS